MKRSSSAQRPFVKVSVLVVSLPIVVLLGVTVAKVLLRGDTGALSILYPFDGSEFPPEIIAPTIWWDDSNSNADAWQVAFTFEAGGDPIVAVVDTLVWTPDRETWEIVKRRSLSAAAQITVTGLQNLIVAKRRLSADTVRISTSP